MFIIREAEVIASFRSKKGNQIYQIMIDSTNGNKRVLNLISDKQYKVGAKIQNIEVSIPNVNFIFEKTNNANNNGGVK